MKTKIQKVLYFTAFLIHFGIITIVCLYSSMDSYFSFYEKEKPAALEKLSSLMLISLEQSNHYAKIAGIDAGYGFFAPNVASEYYLEYEFLDQHNIPIGKLSFPELKSKEGFIRYTTWLSRFQDKLLEKSSSNDTTFVETISKRQLDTMVRAIAMKYAPESTKEVKAKIYLHHYPSLAELKAGKEIKHSLMAFEESTITIKP
ncbi:MAG: hypothetical protein LAT68_11255 [Cyclobacteriaceae bacterium]|nr:hypothetical protein [Cyclobacteriaceae bacterium]MCH8516893.1 hypothetical protein [Cyclobacteriaceae bacterium]